MLTLRRIEKAPAHGALREGRLGQPQQRERNDGRENDSASHERDWTTIWWMREASGAMST